MKEPKTRGKRGVSGWFEVLKAARSASNGGKELITSRDLVEEAGIQGTETSTPEQVASAWLGKLSRWGYVTREGSEKTGSRGKPRTLYRVTRWGLEYAPRKKPGS